ncbi:MAG TPA: transcriptional repressor LexA [Burkholderiales bacterium]|jgi:repressor LexA|nr:transcriptional repressor LexA [Burkholderiales bacterium]
MEALTDRQAEILRLVRELTEVSGYPPTRAEIAERMGFRSVNAAEQHLRALEKKGAINIESGASRGIRVLDDRPAGRGRLLDLPVVGRVAAGSPILAEEHVQGRYQVDPNLFTPRADYLLRVRGMSMRDAGILEGDLLAVHRTQEARTGQIVVARLADEVTVKRLRRRGSMVALEAENPEFAPIEVDLRRDTLVIEGIAVGVIRNSKSF